ncbi:hypothetical protein Ciccas_003799 [Cichlidogyrus casuarinus]|uniref:Uncharacterized protein n=1 Tax=Cichlidogyrus casuarinus TaxID=1844966 RepID=A0ABD2QDE1_9PLAT
MDWSDGANYFLLKSVQQCGLDFAKVAKRMDKSASVFLSNEQPRDFGEKSCSLQYNFLMATYRQKTDTASLVKDDSALLSSAIDFYTNLRRNHLIAKRDEYQQIIE